MYTVPGIVWHQIAEWARLNQQKTHTEKRIRQYREQIILSGNEINSCVYILDMVMEHASQLLENMPDDAISIHVVESYNEKNAQPYVSLEDV